MNGRKPVDVGVDRNQQQIVLRLSFTSAAISTFALIVVVALAVLIGKSFSHGPSNAGAESIPEVKNGKAYPSVMSVFQGKGNEEPPIAVTPAAKPVVQPPAQNKTTARRSGQINSEQAKRRKQGDCHSDNRKIRSNNRP